MRGGRRGRLGELGRAIPTLLVAVGLLDSALRFAPIDPLTFRAWEALTPYRPSGAAFEPNRRYQTHRSYGDLTAIGNLRSLRRYRAEAFTTDVLGFRNAAHVLGSPVDAILVGDSFAVGVGVLDDETLASRLSEPGDCRIYNAGGEAPGAGPDRILALARHLHMRHRLVIRLYSEDSEVPDIPTAWAMTTRRLVVGAPADAQRLVGRLRGILTVSPLKILAERTWKTLEDDRILPNKEAGYVVRGTLYNGDTMLFLTSRVKRAYERREAAAGYWKWLGDELRKEGFDLLLVLAPGKYTVYRPFLVSAGPVGPTADDYLERLERESRAAGVSVLSLAPVFRAEAARSMADGKYLYWPDDTHWNARGVALAAMAIREQWPRLGTLCRDEPLLRAQKP